MSMKINYTKSYTWVAILVLAACYFLYYAISDWYNDNLASKPEYKEKNVTFSPPSPPLEILLIDSSQPIKVITKYETITVEDTIRINRLLQERDSLNHLLHNDVSEIFKVDTIITDDQGYQDTLSIEHIYYSNMLKMNLARAMRSYDSTFYVEDCEAINRKLKMQLKLEKESHFNNVVTWTGIGLVAGIVTGYAMGDKE